MKKETENQNQIRLFNVIIGFTLFGIFALASCKKYEDGPMLSLKSKKERVANTWEIETAYRDGENVTDDYEEYILSTQKDGDASLAALYKWGDFSFEFETDGTWSFENNAENLVLDFENDEADNEYQILRLAEEELWLREIGGEDELHLKPTK